MEESRFVDLQGRDHCVVAVDRSGVGAIDRFTVRIELEVADLKRRVATFWKIVEGDPADVVLEAGADPGEHEGRRRR